MIQSIYSIEESNSNNLDKEDMVFKLPKNIRQIGQVNLTKKIYAEDYVMTYIKQLAEKAIVGDKKAVLLGQYIKAEGTRHIFINGAVEITDSQKEDETVFSNEVWTEIYDCIKKYFTNVEIVGWYITKNDGTFDVDEHITKMHLDNFAGQDKTLLVYDTIEKEEAFYFYDKGTLQRQSGYYIYYERNEEMQNYMIENNEHRRSEEGYVDVATQKMRKVFEAKAEANKQKSLAPLVYTASSLLAVVVLVIGVTMINNYDKEEGGEEAVTVLSEGVVNQEKEGDKSKETTHVETIGSSIDREIIQEDSKVSSIGSDTDDVQNMIEENEAARKKNEKEQTDEDSKKKIVEQDKKKEKQSSKEKQNEEKESKEKKTNKEKEDDIKKEQASTKNGELTADKNIKIIEEYTVKKGDTLVSISSSVYGTIKGVDILQQVNNIEDQDLIYEGQVIKIPER